MITRSTILSNHPWRGLAVALLAANAATLLLFLFRVTIGGSWRYWFLLWNLGLAWTAPLMAWLLIRRLRHSRWIGPGNIGLTLLWLGFLPNSFYLVSDLVHLRLTGEVNVLYDAVMFTLFIFNSYAAGFFSLFWVHQALLKRLTSRVAHGVVAAVLLACSFAIYLGRVLRWNTWDVVINPAGVLFDVSEQFINPVAHPQVLLTTATFFVLLAAIYAVLWNLVTGLRQASR